jgi:uncharacterized protein YeaO (DUF488 family)
LSPYRWIRELVPSFELIEMAQKRRWSRELFQRAYWLELERQPAQQAIQRLFEENEDNYVTFLYAGPEPMKSSAYFLKRYIAAYGHPAVQPISLAA